MSLLALLSRPMQGRGAAVSGGGDPPPSGDPGVNVLNNSKLAGSTTSAADGWSIRFPGEGAVTFSASAVAEHRKVRFQATGTSDRAAIDQAYTVTMGTRYVWSAYVVAVDDASDAARVVLNHAPFSSAAPVGGAAARPAIGDLSPGDRISYAFDATVSGSLTLVMGLDGAGDVTLDRPMLDQASELRGYVATDFDSPPPVATIPAEIGVAMIARNVMPRVMKYNNYTVSQGITVAKSGTITALGFECASNNADDYGVPPLPRAKSEGTGIYTLQLKLTAGQPAIAGDTIESRDFPLGSVPLSSVLIRPDFSQVLRTGSVTHDRNTNTGDGDGRRWHWWTLSSPLAVTAGDKLCLVGYALSSGALTNYISYTNGPTTSPSSSIRLAPPWDLVPVRARSPRDGNFLFGCVATETFPTTSVEANKRYMLRPESGCQLTLLYTDGDKRGLGLRENNGLESQAVVGGNNRLRERFRYLGDTYPCRYVWLPCHWNNDGSIPTSSLTLALTDETAAATWTAAAVAQSVGGTDDITRVHPFSVATPYHSATSYPDFVRFDLGSARTITSGRDFRIELSSSDGSRLYRCFAARHSLTAYDTTDSPGPPRTALPARVGQANPDVLSYVERSTNGGSSWAGLALYGSNRTDVSLCFWMQPEI